MQIVHFTHTTLFHSTFNIQDTELSPCACTHIKTRAITKRDHTPPPANCHRAGFGHRMENGQKTLTKC